MYAYLNHLVAYGYNAVHPSEKKAQHQTSDTAEIFGIKQVLFEMGMC